MSEEPVRAPHCPGCGEVPRLVLDGRQAFCGNTGCRVLTWDTAIDPARFKAVATKVPNLLAGLAEVAASMEERRRRGDD